MKVQFFDPFPAVLGRQAPLPEELARAAEDLDGLTLELTAGAALIHAACPDAKIWVYRDSLMIGVGSLPAAEGHSAPKETWRVIRFRSAPSEPQRLEEAPAVVSQAPA